MCVGVQGFEDGVDGLEASEFECAEDRHQHGLRQGTSVALVGVAVLADHHRWTNGPFTRIVVSCHVVITQKRQQLAVVFLHPLRQSPGIGMRPVFDSEVDQPAFQTKRLEFVVVCIHRGFLSVQFLGITRDRYQSAAERISFPVAFGFLVHGSHIAQQMRPAFLLVSAVDGIVRRPEVGNQRPVEIFREELLQSGRTP